MNEMNDDKWMKWMMMNELNEKWRMNEMKDYEWIVGMIMNKMNDDEWNEWW